MKRKVANAAKLRLSPNEEALILKEDYERRRKLRLLQVREQERDIALQIREDIKQRRNQQFTRLAEELRAEWEDSQTQKIQNLEKLYLASLRTMGEGHRQAKENEPDLDAVARRAAERKRRAQMRHKEALKLQKNQKEILTKEKTWHIQARKEALLMEKVRSTKIASLPPPPPTLFESIDVKRTSAVKPSSSTYHHMSTFVSREKDTKLPDAHLAAEEEAKRLDELQKQAAQEKMEQYEKAHVRGFQAMQKIHLAQNQEKLMKELKQLQQEDLARRRQTVAQMPPQLVELPYKRSEMKEDWQRELEFAFEDMYNADRKVKGNLILHLEPEPLPTVTDQIQDEELDLSVEQEGLGETENLQMTEAKIISSEPEVPLTMKTKQVSSKILFKKLLNKIRSQKSLWTIKSLSEDESEMITTVNEMKSKASTSESGTGQEQDAEGDRLTIESGPLTSEDTLPSGQIDSRKEQEINETLPVTTVAQSAVLLHPQEEAARVRISARQKQIMEIEEQKQKQLELLEQIEQQKLRLEIDCFRAQLEEEKGKKTQQTEVGAATVSCTVLPDEDSHRQMIRNYQHQLLQQNRLHKQSIETARKRLLEYQSMLKRRYPSMSATSLVSDSVVLVPPQKPERLTAVSEHRDQSQRPKLSPNKYQPTQLIQISRLEHDPFQVQKQSHFPQKQAERTETLSTPDVLARQYLESQEHLRQFTQTETQQKNYKSSKPDEPSLFLPLLPQRSFTSLPIKVESGKTHKPFSTMSKSAVAESHSVISQMHYGPLPFSENITAQQNHLKVLQEQLDLHKEALQARQEAQEQLLLCKQKQLEEQIGFSLFLPLHSSASLHGAKPESGKIQESSPIKVDTALSSGDSVVPQLQDRHLSFSQPVCLPQQTNFKFLQEKLNIQKDSLQARREAQEVLYIHKQSQLDGRVDSEQAEPSHLPFQVGQHAFTSPPSTDTKSRKIQEQCLPTSEKGFLSSQYEITKSEEESSGFLQQFLPLHDSLKLLKEQLTAQRDALQARHEAQMELLLHRQRDLRDSKSGHISSFSPMIVGHSFPSQDSDAESRRIEKPYLSEKEHVSPSSHLLVPTFQDKSLSLPQHSLPQQDLTALHEQSHIQRVILGAGQETQHKQSALENIQGNTFEETGLSSFIPQLAQASSPLLPSESGATQVFLSTESDNKIPSSQFQIPELQDRLLRISQLIQPQKDNLNALQEQLATQREAIFQLRQEAQEEQLLHRESEWKGRLSPEQVATSSLPQVAQHPFTSLPLTVSERTQESCSTNSDYTISSSHSEMPRLPDRLLGLSHSVLPQQDNLISLQEHLHAQANSLPSIEKTSKEFILPRQGKYEEKVSNEHFIQTHHDDLKALQQQLDIQRKAIRSRQEVQEEVLFKRLSKLEKRVSSEQISSSSFLPLDALPFASSDRTQKSLPTESNGTLPSSHPEITRSQDRLLSFSQPIHQQGNVTAQMDLPGEVCSSKRPQEELLLNKVNKLNKSESTEHAIPTFFKETEHSFIPLPFAEAKSKSICELHSSKNEHAALPSDSVFPRFEDRLLSFSQPVLAQQDNLGLQKQLGFEREVLHCSQQAQEELQVQRQTALQQQIQKHQETLKDFFKDNQTSNSTVENDLKMQKLGHFREWLPRIQDLASNDQENSRVDRSNSDYNQLLSEHTSAKQSGEHLDKELGRRSSKPPVAKVRCGLEVNQHELSAIQEVESPASVRTSIPGKPDFCQDRDPMRVSISREQSFLGSPLACDPLVCLQSVAQDSVCGDEHDKAATRGLTFVLVRCDHGVALSAVGTPPGIQRNAKALLIVPVQVKESEVENHAVLSFAVEEEYPRLGLIVKPDDKAETQAISPEPISSETVSTGSFLSYENIDLNLTDPEHMDYRKQESTTGKEEKAAVDLDFPELEHIFPHLHRQLFRPLEPHPDFGLSPSSSGISQDNRDFYQASDSSSEIHGATASSKRSLSLTALRTSLHSPNTSLNQQTNPDLALAAAQSFATENTEEPEQSFRQLLSEFSSQEESQHVDLPSIFSVEARYSSEGMDNQNYLSEEQTKILHNKKKSVHFQLSVENLSSVCSSSDEANVFDQVHVQHSTPCGSTSSECSIKHQLERKDKLGFEELSKRGIVTMLESQELTENGQDEAYRVLAVNPDREEADSQLCIRTVEKGSSLQIPAIVPIQNEKCFEDSPKTETPETLRNLSQLAKSEPFESSGSFSLQSSIPVWETESGHGIMEEPELTLVSTSDISIAETDFANLTLEEKEENEAKSCFQVSEFLPLVPETETSDHLPLSECSTDKSATVSTETLLEFTAIPGSLQEAFVKRKKSFIQRSCQRQKEIRNKIRISENSQIKTAKEKPPTGSFVNRLKGVSKVRVSVPEDRKTTHQRALRLYNQLAEVKQQKEEKAKQEAFAQNRARAKEFHKKTLQKLRAKNTR